MRIHISNSTALLLQLANQKYGAGLVMTEKSVTAGDGGEQSFCCLDKFVTIIINY